MTPVIIRGLGHRRSGMLKSYFIEHMLLPFLKYVFKKNGYMQSKVITSKLHTPTSICFISQINIMHEYTGTESKYTDKTGQIACGNKYT